MTLRAEFVKLLKKELLKNGYSMVNVFNTGSKVEFSKKVGQYYRNLSVFTDASDFVYAKVTISKLMHTGYYCDDFRSTFTIRKKDLYIFVHEKTGRYNGYWLTLTDYPDLQTGFNQFMEDFKLADEYYEQMEKELESSEAVKNQISYLSDIADEFYLSKIDKIPVEVFFKTLDKIYYSYVEKYKLSGQLEFNTYARIITAYEMFNKKFEASLKTPIEIKNKFLFFCIYKLHDGTAEGVIWDMIYIKTDFGINMRDTSSLLYSTFMTFIENRENK